MTTPSPPPAGELPEPNDERAAFEAWLVDESRPGHVRTVGLTDHQATLFVGWMARAALSSQAARREPLTNDRILHLWDTFVGDPHPRYPFEDGDKLAFARAVLAADERAARRESEDTRDAERYRWLRDVSVPLHNFYISVPVEFDGVRYAPAEVDAAIDAAIALAAGGNQS